MELRRRKKKSIHGIISDIKVPFVFCAFITSFIILLCLRTPVNPGGPRTRTTTTSRSAEDAQYQLKNRQIYRQNNNTGVKTNKLDDGESLVHIDYRDPGLTDKSLTRLEKSRVEKLRLPRTIETVDSDLPYDVHRCPLIIPENYPYAWSVLDVLQNWNPDDTRIPDTIYQGLCVIDWNDGVQRKLAVHYRQNELPFVIKNHPNIWRAVDRWSDYDYLHEMLGDETYRSEHSKNNHMMYWKLKGKRRRPLGWNPPTEDVKLSYPDWYQKATSLEDDQDSSSTSEHFYFRINAGKRSNKWLYDELPFFKPSIQNDIFMVDPFNARGINCRLGSRGTIAELHYDESRNFILMLHGQKRYILSHPDQCTNMELYPPSHPSARHSRINWSNPESWLHGGKDFRNGMVNEVVLEAGDGLYLPTFWFHFIVSLSLNYQCNARSGTTYEYESYIRSCGF